MGDSEAVAAVRTPHVGNERRLAWRAYALVLSANYEGDSPARLAAIVRAADALFAAEESRFG